VTSSVSVHSGERKYVQVSYIFPPVTVMHRQEAINTTVRSPHGGLKPLSFIIIIELYTF